MPKTFVFRFDQTESGLRLKIKISSPKSSTFVVEKSTFDELLNATLRAEADAAKKVGEFLQIQLLEFELCHVPKRKKSH